MKRFSRIALLVFAVVFVLFPASSRAAVSPVAVVEEFHAQLLSIMKQANTLSVKDRFAELAPTMDKTFDLKRMIRVACGPQWAKADETQRQHLVEAFRRLSVATYAEQFNGYSGEKFETLGKRPGPQNTILVQTRIVQSSGSNVGLIYVMKQDGEQWRIADVLLDDSVSQLAVRRSEYRKILADSGVSGLITTLDKKANQLLAE